MSCNTATFKRGTTFAATVSYNPETGGAPSLSGINVTSVIRDAQGNEYDLTIVKAIDNMSFLASYSSTSSWAIGQAKWDIKFDRSGDIFYSDTLRLDVIPQITE